MGNRGEKPRVTSDMCPDCGPGRPENDRIDYCICPPVDRIVGYASNPNDPGRVIKLQGPPDPESEWWASSRMGQPLYKIRKLGKAESRAVAIVQRVRSVVEGITNWLRALRRHGPRRTKV